MKLLFWGDFFYDYDGLAKDMEKIVSFVREHEYKVVLNLETALFNLCGPIKKRGPNLISNAITSDILKRLSCVCVCMANNHAMDYGYESLAAAKELLEKNGILCVGAGADPEESGRPVSLNADGKTVLILNFGWDVEETVYATEKGGGCAALDRKKIVDQICHLRESDPDAIIIGCFHMGFEFNTLPMPLDIDFARQCVSSGCDLIIGHHPHVIQPKEEYAGKDIFYSLGNFYFSSRREGFQSEYEREGVDHYGDYGLGVVFDTDSCATSTVGIRYDHEKKESEIIGELPTGILKSLRDCFPDSAEYPALAKSHAYKANPILGLDEKENKKLLNGLQRKYRISQTLQFLKKTDVGRKIYSFIKSKA